MLRGKVGVFLALLMLVDCGGSGSGATNVAQSLEDRDHDGWFSAATNAAMTLTLTSAVFPAVGAYEIHVDDARFPLNAAANGSFSLDPGQSSTQAINLPVATRVRGVNGLGTSGTPFGANVKVMYHTPPFGEPTLTVGTARVAFGETNGALPPTTLSFTFGTVTLNFSVMTTLFADPNPDDPVGDSDGDGIPESIEARLSAVFGGVFDPRSGSARDIDLIVGSVDPAFALAEGARQGMRTQFLLHDFNLHIDTGAPGAGPVEGGLMNLAGTGASTTGDVTPAQALAVRNLNVSPTRRATSYFALLAANTSLDGTAATRAFGWTGLGATVMRTGFVGINDIAWYQGGVLMHELGHSLGLCHPVDQDGTTTGGRGGSMCGVCAAIPTVERDNGGSVMGAPSDDPNFVAAGINALRRPLDYTVGRWGLVRPGCAFTP